MNSNGLGSSKPKKGLLLATVIDVMTSLAETIIRVKGYY